MNLLRTILVISAATATNGFAPAASAPASTRLNISTGEGGQGKEDAAMYYAPPKVGKKVATVDNSLKQTKSAPGSKSSPAWQQAMMGVKKAAPAPAKAAVEEKPKKKGLFNFGK
mmetsp:Transcript_21945/g.53087  ORF Transcript_21945/g.53087 Transcript_21945/m.53087 type:complete len:114 (-) Transcript_21945:97-438(-)|eukprot:CAMPEP_0181102512 /NCGR_PEP_ID=MMETSP1071-20121207/14360_1 /TAXON_ID=35127 /ORGANISM="Thalassiosira sp., Strain NH16" /LENGTH=113 /DNA_ID=CAMNT_0023185501 /DNA_START=116 /DNA_END=457 /DNA_ORIENTATION=+